MEMKKIVKMLPTSLKKEIAILDLFTDYEPKRIPYTPLEAPKLEVENVLANVAENPQSYIFREDKSEEARTRTEEFFAVYILYKGTDEN